MSEARDTADPTAPSRQAAEGQEDGAVGHQSSMAPDDGGHGAQGPCDNPGLYAYRDLILSGLHRLLGGLIGDGARLILIVDERDGNYPQIVGNHPDTWGVFDALTCADDEEPEMGPGSRNRLLN